MKRVARIGILLALSIPAMSNTIGYVGGKLFYTSYSRENYQVACDTACMEIRAYRSLSIWQKVLDFGRCRAAKDQLERIM